MSNAPVPANVEGMSKFDKAAIMRDAWAIYRQFRNDYAPWQIERGIVDASFSRCLSIAWRKAKEARAKAVRQARIDALLLTPAGDRLRALRAALDATQYLSFRYNAADRRAQIEREIEALIQEAA